MKTAFQTRILVIVLAIATLAACVCAGLNIAAEADYSVPTDGVRWAEVKGGLCAQEVPPDSPGHRYGIRKGDVLESIDDRSTPSVASLEHVLFRIGSYLDGTYSIIRPVQACTLAPATHLSIKVSLEPVDRSINYGLRLIAAVYLLIGLYILFRRWTAPKSTHFYVFCLVSFVLYAFKYTGQFDTFDRFIYWSNIAATFLQPALFLHFAITFSGTHPSPSSRIRRHALAAFLYLPGLALGVLQVVALTRWSALEALRYRLDKIAYAYMAIYYLWAAIIFFIRSRRAQDPLQRQQLKWLTRGTLVAVIPFTFLYVVPFLLGRYVPSALANLVTLSLVFLPLTFSWAIVRYRLMDVDLIFKRGVSYTLATASLVGIYFGVLALAAHLVQTHLTVTGVSFASSSTLRLWGLVAAVVATGLIFDPLKRLIQARVDRVFDRKRFDYRETLIDFGRSLNSQTDLATLLSSVVERLPQTLLVTRVAVFLAAESSLDLPAAQPALFELAASHGLDNLVAASMRSLNVSFLDFDSPQANTHVFLENPQAAVRLTESQREAAAALDLNYYLPCRVANRRGPGARTVAIIGLGRTNDGDFLSSEDMEVLESLAGYIGIAIQNAQLYRRLESKINEFERLKDFNQNIVESINIGIFAVDLEGRIESWNSQMEVLFARSRGEAFHAPLEDIFPADFMARFDAIRNDPGAQGTHTLYKFRLALPTGETRVANIAIAPLLTRTFDVIGRIILVDDITDRMQMEAQLTQSEKLSSIGLLAAGVAHEVNTPLAVISSYTQMLSKQIRADEALAKRLSPVLEKITQQTFRASEIVNGLLNFSRTSGAEFIRIDLNQLLHDSAILLEHQFKTARIRVEQGLTPTLAPIQGNPGKLQQVILNLMLNAKDAMSGSGESSADIPRTLKLRTFNEGTCSVLEIEDSGTGIEPEHLLRIFDPFFTTKTAPKPGEHKGTGLGLAVSYGILQEHGGKIKVDSTPGHGTTFRLEIPAVQVAVPTVAS